MLLFLADGHAEVLHDSQHILPQGAAGADCFVAQQVTGVVSDTHRHTLAFEPLATQGAYPLLSPQQPLGRAAAQAHNAGGTDCTDFGHDERQAGCQFLRAGGAVGRALILTHGGAEFTHIGNIHLTALQPHGFEHFGKQLPSRAHKRFPLAFFLIAGSLTHQHEPGMRVAHGKDHSLPQCTEPPGGFPVCRTLLQVGKFLLHTHFRFSSSWCRCCRRNTSPPGIHHPLAQNTARLIIHRQTLLPPFHHVGEGFERELLKCRHSRILAHCQMIARRF